MATERPTEGSGPGTAAAGASDAARPVPRADVARMLAAYRAALDLTAALPPSWKLPHRGLTRLAAALRPRWQLQRFMVEDARAAADVLSRRYCLRLALHEDDGNDVADREALREFSASLPDRPSRLMVLVPIVAVLAVSQVLLPGFDRVEGQREALDEVTTIVELNPVRASRAIQTLVTSDLAVILNLVALLSAATYLVLRPVVPAWRLKRMILDLPGAIRPRHEGSPLAAAAREIALHREQVALFAALGMRPRGEPMFDLWVSGLGATFWLAGGLYLLLETSSPASTFGAVLVVGSGAWLARLVRERRRRQPLGRLALAHTRAAPD